MRRHKTIGILLYIVFDFLAAFLAWTGLYVFRRLVIEQSPLEWETVLGDQKFILAVIFLPIAWVLLYAALGFYSDIYRKSRMAELVRTFVTTLLGSVVLFFSFILDDIIGNYRDYYASLGVLFGLQFSITFFFRLMILNRAKRQLKSRKVGYKTLMIGSNHNATELYEDIEGRSYGMGYNFVGFVEVDEKSANGLRKHLTKLGTAQELKQVIAEHQIEEVIIALESNEHDQINAILNELSEHDLIIKMIPDMYDILRGSVKMNHVIGAVLIEIYPELMPKWQRVIKRSFDIVFSSVVMLLLSPLYAYVALRVRMSSAGPIFYKQERIGKGGKPFNIIKFRSMYVDAEKHGPALSSDNDPRITKWGRVMRKWRLDEIPQFWNVLMGDMSIVGPRPERRHYIDLITEKAPHFRHLLKVQPGITSWGMVKFGYAENVDQMIQRLKWDVLYIENMSVALDFKIMIYTVLTLIQGKGK